MSERTMWAGLPVIKVDDRHWQIEQPDGSEALIYEVPPGAGLILDATGYEIRVPPFPGVTISGPNMIQLAVDSARMYGVEWQDGIEKYYLVPETLVPLYGSIPFTGLLPGWRFILAIGFHRLDPATMTANFYPLWYALVDVRPSTRPQDVENPPDHP